MNGKQIFPKSPKNLSEGVKDSFIDKRKASEVRF